MNFNGSISGSTTNLVSVAKVNTSTPRKSVSLAISRIIQSTQTQLTSINLKSRKTERKLIKAIKENDDFYIKQKLTKHPKLAEKTLNDRELKRKFTPLGLACYQGSVDVMSELLQAGADVNKVDDFMSSPLMLAVTSHSLDTVKLLLKYEPDVNQKNKIGNHSASIAAAGGQLEVLKTLIQNGADIYNEAGEDKTSTIVSACKFGSPEVVRFLIEKGVNVNQQSTKNQCTPLHLAVKYRHTEVAKFLLEQGANPNLENIEGNTPLYLAKRNKDNKLVGMLLDSGAKDKNEQENHSSSPKRKFLSFPNSNAYKSFS